ncbi:hypothetical protein FHX75_11187 [Micromonospora palomenae]|uniref:Uncharacterized protein n=1 Tax=Micromonospora palomenae TaxID=1461247 RepID=A0A561WT50_9ACTN|nr:hypothetical protein FHX75_11187 [Micromonospora palomenae]
MPTSGSVAFRAAHHRPFSSCGSNTRSARNRVIASYAARIGGRMIGGLDVSRRAATRPPPCWRSEAPAGPAPPRTCGSPSTPAATTTSSDLEQPGRHIGGLAGGIFQECVRPQHRADPVAGGDHQAQHRRGDRHRQPPGPGAWSGQRQPDCRDDKSRRVPLPRSAARTKRRAVPSGTPRRRSTGAGTGTGSIGACGPPGPCRGRPPQPTGLAGGTHLRVGEDALPARLWIRRQRACRARASCSTSNQRPVRLTIPGSGDLHEARCCVSHVINDS